MILSDRDRIFLENNITDIDKWILQGKVRQILDAIGTIRIVLIEKDLHHQIIMIPMSLDEKLRKYMIEFMKITVFD